MRYAFLNNFSQILAADLAAGATTLTLDVGGSLLSNASADLVYTLTLVEKDSDGNEIGWEVVHVTGATGNDLTIVRAQEGTTDAAWPTGTAVEMRVTAGVMAGASGAVQLGVARRIVAPDIDTATGSASFTVGEGATNLSDWSVVITPPTYDSFADEYTYGGVISDTGSYAPVVIGAGANINKAAGLSGYGEVVIGTSASTKADGSCVVIGADANDEGSGEGSVIVGPFTAVEYGTYNTVVGAEAWIYAPTSGTGQTGGTAVGSYASVGSWDDNHDELMHASAFGADSTARRSYSTALGGWSETTVEGGLRTVGISYLPKKSVKDYSPFGPDTAIPRASQQATIQTEPLDLTTANDVQTLDLPADIMLFVDSIEVVVTGSDTPGGTPEVQVGTDAGTPADLLAATPVGKTAVGGRETHTPLIADGVTSIRAEVTTAGTGTTYQARVIVKGFVMEL